MHFAIPFLLAYISGIMTLEPGDLIATGTPAGVGPLHDGDVVEVEIPGVGVLSNPVRNGDLSMIQPSDRLRALPGYPLAEIPTIKRRLLEAGVDVIDLGAGDNDTPPPAVAVEAMSEALADPAYSKYGFQQGLPAFRQAASRWLERRFGQHFDPATELLPLIGSKEGLSHLPFAVVNPGDVTIVPEPGYQAYIGGSILAGAEPYIAPLRPENDFLLDLEQVPEPCSGGRSSSSSTIPNNPTAAIAPLEYLERTVAVCRKHGILLAYDNAYCDLTFDGYRAPSIFEIPGARDVAVEFFSLSKSFSMTGWRLGFAAGRPELIGALTRVKSYTDTGPFLAVQKAGAAALDQAEALVAPIRAELRAAAGRRGRGAARGRASRVEAPKAAMYLWVAAARRHRRRPRSRRAPWKRPATVVLPGSAFGPAGEGFFRIALTVGRGPAARGGRRGWAARSRPSGEESLRRPLELMPPRSPALADDRDRGQRARAQPSAVRLDRGAACRCCRIGRRS